MERLVLASGSPRRSELLQRLGIPFDILVSGTDESQDGHDDARMYAIAMSRNKAMEVAEKLRREGLPKEATPAPDGYLVLAADTVVAREGHILGKPVDPADAARMLMLLADGWHEVITALTLVRTKDMRVRVETETTRVRFRDLDNTMITHYLATGEAADKAGAYGVQGYGSLLVERMDGDYYNVMGLPLHRLSRMLESMGIPPYTWLAERER